MQKKLPQTIISAIRRRAAAAAKWQIADAQISAYCKKHGIKTEYVNMHVHTVRETDPEFFIRDSEQCRAGSEQEEKE